MGWGGEAREGVSTERKAVEKLRPEVVTSLAEGLLEMGEGAGVSA